MQNNDKYWNEIEATFSLWQKNVKKEKLKIKNSETMLFSLVPMAQSQEKQRKFYQSALFGFSK
jgi:hypothetical protein